MKKIGIVTKLICRIYRKIKVSFNNNMYIPFLLSQCKECGDKVSIGYDSLLIGMENMSFGNRINIGSNSVFFSTMANLKIGSYVMSGPHLTIMTGEHRSDLVGEYMINITNDNKLPQNDRDVIIEDDVWIGSNVTILKGVTIGRGSIIHAGVVLTKSVKPYTIYISDKLQVPRFSSEEIEKHEMLLHEKYGEGKAK